MRSTVVSRLGASEGASGRSTSDKLSSLEEFTAVTSRDLKRALVDRALGEEAGKNDVQVRWWKMLGEDDGIGLAQLVHYYLSLSTKQDDAFLDASSREIF